MSAGSRNSRTSASTTKQASVLNCRVRYAEAPSCTAAAISCIFSVPWSAASTVAAQRDGEAERDQRDDRDHDDVGEVGTAQVERARRLAAEVSPDIASS